MKKLLAQLPQIAASKASVFITGESGTGKEVIAGLIHTLSPRKEQPFIKVNCAAIPETLIESEFFGHEKGAFTGAHMRQIGRFERADQGTLFLDEVSETPAAFQSKLLRAVQELEFERVGGRETVHVNVRFISTSNRNMSQAIEDKQFRKDLFYRLNVVPIHLPSLKERKEDIIPLATYFLEKLGGNHSLSEGAKDALLAYSFPGNIRELANLMERTAVLAPNPVIEPEDLNLKKQQKSFPTLKEIEKKHILQTLKMLGNNRTKTASALGISVRTLRNKLQEYKGVSL